jgi:translation initiation factor 1A
MAKNKKGAKNKKNNGPTEKRKLIEADIDGQLYGILEKVLGNRFFDVKCLDGKTRRCKVRNRRMKVKQGDCVIVSLRDFDDKNGDIIYRYDIEEVRELKKIGELPDEDINGLIMNDDMDDDIDGGFCFEDI